MERYNLSLKYSIIFPWSVTTLMSIWHDVITFIHWLFNSTELFKILRLIMICKIIFFQDIYQTMHWLLKLCLLLQVLGLCGVQHLQTLVFRFVDLFKNYYYIIFVLIDCLICFYIPSILCSVFECFVSLKLICKRFLVNYNQMIFLKNFTKKTHAKAKGLNIINLSSSYVYNLKFVKILLKSSFSGWKLTR